MPTVNTTWSMPLKGVRLLYMHESDAAVVIGLETEFKSVVCPACGSNAVVGYGKMIWKIRDLPIDRRPVFLEIKRRRLRCRDCLVTFNEPVPNTSINHRATTRLAQRVWQLALRLPFTALSQTFRMDEKTIRNIFTDTFNTTATQFKATAPTPVPTRVVIRIPRIVRQQRVMWINPDHGTLIDMDDKITPEIVRASLQRITRGKPVQIHLPPDEALIEILANIQTVQLVLHPPAMKGACNDLIDLGRSIPGAVAYVERLLTFVRARSAVEARQAWQALLAPPPGLRSKMRQLIAAVERFPADCFAAFDQPDPPCDVSAAQLEKILSTDFSKRSYDVICAIVLFDKTLQKTARIGVAQDGAHLGYQKANYGTSIAKLVAKLEKLRGLEIDE